MSLKMDFHLKLNVTHNGMSLKMECNLKLNVSQHGTSLKEVSPCFIVSLGALISHEKFQHDSSTPSLFKFEIELTIRIGMGNAPKNIQDV